MAAAATPRTRISSLRSVLAGRCRKPKSFVYVPKAANMLRERELHVEALERQLAEIKADRQALLELFRQQTRELEERNQWAQRLDTDLKTAGERIAALQNEAAELAAGYQAQVARMEQEDQVKTEWARKASAELEAKCQELARLRRSAGCRRSHGARTDHMGANRRSTTRGTGGAA